MACNQLADAPRVSAPRRRPYLEAEAAQDAPDAHLDVVKLTLNELAGGQQSTATRTGKYDEAGLMQRRVACIKDLPIAVSDRKFHGRSDGGPMIIRNCPISVFDTRHKKSNVNDGGRRQDPSPSYRGSFRYCSQKTTV